MDNSEITNIEKLAKKADWSAIVDATTNVYDNIESASAQLLATAATNCLEAMLKLTESGEMGEEQMLRKMPQLAALLKKLKSDDPALYKSEAKRCKNASPISTLRR